MTTSSHLSDNLGLLAHETSLLMRTAAGLDDETVRAASLCQGWTRAHVLSHLARNADALGKLVSWATAGTPVAMYESPQARDADIVAGSTRRRPGDLRRSGGFCSAVRLSGSRSGRSTGARRGRDASGAQSPGRPATDVAADGGRVPPRRPRRRIHVRQRRPRVRQAGDQQCRRADEVRRSGASDLAAQ